MFDQVWDEAQQDVERGAVASVDNLVESVTSAREGFNDNPRHLLVLVQSEKPRGRLIRNKLQH